MTGTSDSSASARDARLQTAQAPDADGAASAALAAATHRLRILSFNIQVAMHTRHPADYLTGAWRHVLPTAHGSINLDRIADIIRGYDFVAIQEGDAGSLRTRFRNQIAHLAQVAGYRNFDLTVTRDLHPIARHCLGFLSQANPVQITDLPLPTPIPGRRALRIDMGPTAGGAVFIVTHLSLGARAQERQLAFLAEQIPPNRPAILLGDLNCDAERLQRHGGLRRAGLVVPQTPPATYPSWRPRRAIDHILATPDVILHRLEALPFALSDHLPIAAEIEIPALR